MTTEVHPDLRELRATNARLAASVRMLLDRQPPEYGAPAWHALPAGHPDRERAVWRAAEAWRRYWTPEAIAARLRAELDLADRIWLERFKAMTADVSRAWDAVRYCAGPSFLELQRRRATPARGEPTLAEAQRLARYAAALNAQGASLNDPSLTVRQAQRAAFAGAHRTAGATWRREAA